jgi:hypothetical protein
MVAQAGTDDSTVSHGANEVPVAASSFVHVLSHNGLAQCLEAGTSSQSCGIVALGSQSSPGDGCAQHQLQVPHCDTPAEVAERSTSSSSPLRLERATRSTSGCPWHLADSARTSAFSSCYSSLHCESCGGLIPPPRESTAADAQQPCTQQTSTHQAHGSSTRTPLQPQGSSCSTTKQPVCCCNAAGALGASIKGAAGSRGTCGTGINASGTGSASSTSSLPEHYLNSRTQHGLTLLVQLVSGTAPKHVALRTLLQLFDILSMARAEALWGPAGLYVAPIIDSLSRHEVRSWLPPRLHSSAHGSSVGPLHPQQPSACRPTAAQHCSCVQSWQLPVAWPSACLC